MYCCRSCRERCSWRKGGKKIIKIMTKISWYMSLDDPMESLCKEVKYVGCGLDPKHEDYHIVEMRIPMKAEEWPVLRPDRNMPEGILKVKFG
jgi:hypothetical protein